VVDEVTDSATFTTVVPPLGERIATMTGLGCGKGSRVVMCFAYLISSAGVKEETLSAIAVSLAEIAASTCVNALSVGVLTVSTYSIGSK
jgi:hypothetical protein